MTFDWRVISEFVQKSCENVNLYSSPDSEYLIVNFSKSISGYGGYLFSAKKTLITMADSPGRKSLMPLKMSLPLSIPGGGFIWRVIIPHPVIISHESIWPRQHPLGSQ